MLFLFDTLVFAIILTGLACTLIPRLPGNLMLGAGLCLYGASIRQSFFFETVFFLLLLLISMAEIGSRLLKKILLKEYQEQSDIGITMIIGNIGGMIASEFAFGFAGQILWQFVAGKSIFAQWKLLSQIAWKAFYVALWRLGCGIAMVVIFWLSVGL